MLPGWQLAQSPNGLNPPSGLRRKIEPRVGFQQVREENLGERIHQGGITGLGFSFNGRRYPHGWDSWLGYSRLRTPEESLPLTIDIRLGSRYSVRLMQREREKTDWQAGVYGQLEYRITHYANWDESHLYWASQLSLGLFVRRQQTFRDKYTLGWEVYLNGLGFLSRPEQYRMHKMDDFSPAAVLKGVHSHVQGGSWNRLIQTEGNIYWRWNLKGAFQPAIAYSFTCLKTRSSFSKPYTGLAHIWSIRGHF